MCAEFQQRDFDELAAETNATPAPFFGTYVPKYPTMFPGCQVAAVGRKPNSTQRGMFPLKWGLLPSFAADPSHKPQPVNARHDTVDRYDVFRESFRTRRCLIPADAFYDWTKSRPKRRFRFTPEGDSIFGLAGIWDVWGEGKDRIWSCAFVTCDPGELMATIHDRQPVLLPPASGTCGLTRPRR